MLVIEDCSNCKAVTILVRGGSKMIVQEAERSLHDALCVVSTLIRCNRIVWGGGASEIAASLAVNNYANKINSTEQYAVRAFADALEQIPMALAENSGLNALKVLTQAKGEQADRGEPFYGIDCMSTGNTNMKELKIFETLLSKKGQLQLATQVVKMILKIDDVIEPSSE
jgi:T-complex protein 1 subunit epsilon